MSYCRQFFCFSTLAFLVAPLFFSIPGWADSIYKCVNDGTVSYQSTPCSSGTTPYKQTTRQTTPPPQQTTHGSVLGGGKQIATEPRPGKEHSTAGPAINTSDGQTALVLHVQCGSNQDPADCRREGVRGELTYAISDGNTGRALLLIKELRDIRYLSSTDVNHTSPLAFAIEKGNPVIVQALLERGVDPLARNPDGKSLLSDAIDRARRSATGLSPAVYQCLGLALDKAAAAGTLKPLFPLSTTQAFHPEPDPTLLRFFLKYGADPDLQTQVDNRRGPSAIEIALKENLPEMMKIILDTKPHAPARNTDKMAYQAFLDTKPEILKLLRTAGGDPARYAKNEPQALSDALLPAQRTEVLEFVLNNGANPNVLKTTSSRNTPLSMAIPYPDKLRLLVEHGADVNARGSGGAALVEVLFRAGMDVYTPPGQQAPPPYPKMEIVRLLLKSGAKVNGDLGGIGRFGALAATKRGDTEVIQLLLDHGATLTAQPDPRRVAIQARKDPDDPSLIMPEPEGPVLLAIGLERDDLALALLARDKKVDPKDRLALLKAVRKGWDDVALALLRAGADVSAADSQGISVLAIARNRRNTELERALVAAGAPATTQPAPLLFKGSNPFETLVGNTMDRSVHFDPPSFALTDSRGDKNLFVFYSNTGLSTTSGHGPEDLYVNVKCSHTAAFQFIAHANLSGGIRIGLCDSDIPRLRQLADQAEPFTNKMLESINTSGAKTDTATLKKLGWVYEKNRGKDGTEIYHFPVMAFGHGVFVAPTVVVIAPDGRLATLVQADTSNLCENHRMRTPLCENTNATLIEIAQNVLQEYTSSGLAQDKKTH